MSSIAKKMSFVIMFFCLAASSLPQIKSGYESPIKPFVNQNFKSKSSSEKIAFLFGGGIGVHITVNDPNPYYQEQYKTAIALSLGIIPYSDGYHALRFSLGYTKSAREDQTYSSFSYGYNYDSLLSTTHRTGGDRKKYAIGMDIVAGYLKQKSPFNAYGFWSMSTGIYENSKIYDFTTISNKNSVNSYTNTKGSENLFFADMGIGGGISIKVFNKFRIYTELQYNFWSLGWSFGEGDITSKAGFIFVTF